MSAETNAPAAVVQALSEARQFDRSRISPRNGLIAALPVAAVLGLGTAIGQPVAAVTMGAGAMLGGVAWRAAGPDDPPVATMVVAIAGLGLATVAGSASGRYGWLHLALLIVLCLCAGLLVSLGRRGSVVGTQAIIAYIVFGRFPQSLDSALGLAGLVMAGGAVQAAFATVVGLPPAWRLQRQALVEAYRQLASLAAAPEATSASAAAALDEAEMKLTAPALLGDPALMTLSSLVEVGRRIRLELIALGTVAGTGTVPESALAARVLTAVADAVADPQGEHEAALGAARDALEAGWQTDGSRQLAALAGQFRAAAALAEVAQHGRPWAAARPSRGSRRPLVRLRSDLQQLRANASLYTAAGRHALRLAVVVALAELLVQRAGLPRGYWAVVAAATVLRPEFGATITSGAQRMLGTVLGVVGASLIAVALDPGGWGIVLVVGLLAWATFAVFPASFAAGIALLTGVIVFLLHGIASDTATIALDRGLDSVIGGALGLAAYALWPTWSGGSTGRVMAELVEAQRDYVLAVLGCVVTGSEPVEAALRPLARRARIAWSDADAIVTRARAEPARRLGDSGTRAIASLGGLRRLVYAGHTARLEIAATPDLVPQPAWGPFRDGLGNALTLIADRLRDGAGATPLPPLRTLYREADAEGPLDDALLGPLDEIVDATDTVAVSLGLPVPAWDPAHRG
ncbi:MAG TPA: FUSC family protein [Solirubrobacteraceae bacterium]|nr:FUSC family protein [Solirubrobacteraceae bacterium]